MPKALLDTLFTTTTATTRFTTSKPDSKLNTKPEMMTLNLESMTSQETAPSSGSDRSSKSSEESEPRLEELLRGGQGQQQLGGAYEFEDCGDDAPIPDRTIRCHAPVVMVEGVVVEHELAAAAMIAAEAF